MLSPRRILPLLVLAVCVPSAIGQDWPELRPPREPLAPGMDCELSYVLPGVAADRAGAFASYPLRDLFFVAPGLRQNLDRIVPIDPRRGLLRLGLRSAGLHRVGAETSALVAPVDTSVLIGVLEDCGESRAPRSRLPDEGNVLVRRVLAVSCLVAVGGAGDGVATRKTGLPIETRLLAMPRSLDRSSDLPVRLYVEGEAIPGAIVRAVHESGLTVMARSDRQGIAKLRIEKGGRWCLRFQHLRSGTTGVAPRDWFQSSMVFQAPEKVAPDSASKQTDPIREGR